MPFPILETLDDILPAIQGHDEITVSRHANHSVVNYQFQDDTTFSPTPWGRYRQECRGLIFDAEERLISRPFHKFFNVGEKDWTQPQLIDLTRPYVIQEKLDGSMVRPFYLGDTVHFATRAGITDISEQAHRVFCREDYEKRLRWVRYWLDHGYTPLFEYISPDNRIVLEYDESDVIFLALRHNRTGEYVSSPVPYPGSVVPVHVGEIIDGKMDTYLKSVQEEEDREGDVITFLDGDRYKIKTGWYLELHRLRTEIGVDRLIAIRALNGRMDDLMPVLPESDRERVKEIADDFMRDYRAKVARIRRLVQQMNDWIEEQSADRKMVATQFVPQYPKRDARFCFIALDDKDIGEQFHAEVVKNLGNNPKYEELREWMRT